MNSNNTKIFSYNIEWAKLRDFGFDISETSLISIKKLKKYQEFDRKTNPSANTMLPYYLEALKADIEEFGISQPLVLCLNIVTGFARLTEGNHRIMVAEEVSMDKVPVQLKIDNNLKPNSRSADIGGAFLTSILNYNKYPTIHDIAFLIEKE